MARVVILGGMSALWRERYLQLLFDAECAGNGALIPGVVLDVVVNRYSEDNPIDESLPPRMIISRVAHYQDRFNYRCRAVLGAVKS